MTNIFIAVLTGVISFCVHRLIGFPAVLTFIGGILWAGIVIFYIDLD